MHIPSFRPPPPAASEHAHSATDLPPDPNPGLTVVEHADGSVELVTVAFRPTDADVATWSAERERIRAAEHRAHRAATALTTLAAVPLIACVVAVHVWWFDTGRSQVATPSGVAADLHDLLVTVLCLIYPFLGFLFAVAALRIAAGAHTDRSNARVLTTTCLVATAGSGLALAAVLPNLSLPMAATSLVPVATAAGLALLVQRSLDPSTRRFAALAAEHTRLTRLLDRPRVPASEAGRRTWGAAGAVAPEPIRTAERLVADQMTAAFTAPQARFFHPVATMSGYASLAMLHGDHLAAVEVRPVREGSYSWHRDGHLLRDGAPFPCEDVAVTSLLGDLYTEDFRTVPMAGWVVLVTHPATEGPDFIAVDNTHAPAGVRLVTAADLPAEIRTWLNQEPTNQGPYVDLNRVWSLSHRIPGVEGYRWADQDPGRAK